jgi:hypothetical protein
VRDSLKCGRLIESEWYQQRWGHRYQLTSDQNQKHRFENDQTGYRIATSVGGSATGERADVVVVDDPHSVDQAESDAEGSRLESLACRHVEAQSPRRDLDVPWKRRKQYAPRSLRARPGGPRDPGPVARLTDRQSLPSLLPYFASPVDPVLPGAT